MMSKVSSLGHVGISVTDMDKMLDFYTRILGLTVTDGALSRVTVGGGVVLVGEGSLLV